MRRLVVIAWAIVRWLSEAREVGRLLMTRTILGLIEFISFLHGESF